MVISDVYKKYKIMPQLQTHMFRVAGVASLICDNFDQKLDKKNIISACLLHDLGNIIKFDLTLFPESLKPRGLAYWEKVKNNYINKYGSDEHLATYTICEEIHVNTRTYELIKAVGFSQARRNFLHNNFDKKICAYSDHRVTPYKVASLEDRMIEGRKRYVANKNIKKGQYDSNKFTYLANFMSKIEEQIFARCKIKPEVITDENVEPLLKSLRSFEIQTN